MTTHSPTTTEPTPEPRGNTAGTRSSWHAGALVALIILLGAVLRLTGLRWDGGTHLHPDERFLTMLTSTISFPGMQDIPGASPPPGCTGWGSLLDAGCSPLGSPPDTVPPQPPPGCRTWGGYFDSACSQLNSYNYSNFPLLVYGTFPIFLTRFVGALLGQTSYDEIVLVGRVLSALFDLSTVLLIFVIGRRMFGMRAALLGALFLTASVLDIQQSHFYTVDTFTNVPILIAFWYALDIADGKHWRAFVLAGAAFGLALAGRINLAPFAAVLIAAAALRAQRQMRTEPVLPGEIPPPCLDGEAVQPRERSLGPLQVSVAWRGGAAAGVETPQSLGQAGTKALAGLSCAAACALIVFRFAQPYAANGPTFISLHLPSTNDGPIPFLFDAALSWAGGVNPDFAGNMVWASDTVAGKIDSPPGHQWTNRTPYVFPLENMVLWGLGLPLGLAAWAGFGLAFRHLARAPKSAGNTRRTAGYLLLVVTWVGLTFAITGQQFVKTMRYFLQVYPFLALLAGWFIVQLRDKAAEVGRDGRGIGARLAQAAVAAMALLIVGYTLFWAAAFTTIYTRPYTRVSASRWMYDNIPAGSVIANEQWDDPLPVGMDGKNPFPPMPGSSGAIYKNLSSSSDGEMQWYAEDTTEKRAEAIQWVDEADYIVLSSNRLYCSIPRLPMRYPMTARYYEWLFDGTLGFQRVATFASRPELFGIRVDDDKAEEAFTVYDHPKVIIFKKTPGYRHDDTAALFGSVDLSHVERLTPLQATQARASSSPTTAPSIAELCGE